MGFINDNYVVVLVQHASVQVFGQHVRVNMLQLQTEPFQLHHPPLRSGHRGLRSLWLCLLLPDLLGQVDRSQPGFPFCVGAWSVFSVGGLAPDGGRCCLRTPLAVCQWFDPRGEGAEAGAPAACTGCSSTDVHCYSGWRICWHEKHPQTQRKHAEVAIKSLPGRAFQNKSVQLYFSQNKNKTQIRTVLTNMDFY